MALREEFEATGNWLFRWRSYVPVALIVLVLASMSRFHYPGNDHFLQEIWEAGCLAIAAIGLAVRALVVGTTPSGTSGRNTGRQIAESLNTTGMYSIVRHPLYVGNCLIWLGLAMDVRSIWLGVVVALAFWLYYERIAFAEEEFLRRKFSREFELWAAHTPAFFPRFRNWRSPNLRFSWRNVLRREYSGFFAVAALLAVLDVVGNYQATGRPSLDRFDGIVFTAGLATYVTLRFLKRRTRVLHVAGR